MQLIDYHGNVRWDVIDIIPKTEIANMLEIGGGDFRTSAEIKRKAGCVVWGVDVRVPKDKIENFFEGNFTSAEIQERLPNKHFDLIMANDVLEHIEDTDEFFRAVVQKIAPDGFLVLSVPNIRQLRFAYQVFLKGSLPRNESGLFDRTHLRWFCRLDLMAFFKKYGLVVHDHKYVGRAVPALFSKFRPMEFLALQNIFVCKLPK